VDNPRAELSLTLPGHMVPSRFIWLDQLPLLANFKWSRGSAGLLPDQKDRDSHRGRSPIEVTAAQDQSEALGRTIARPMTSLTREADSLRGMMVSQQIEKRIGRWLPPDAIFLLRKPAR